jgi:adenosylmethionine-8-amino-7-oxononanoate aminotransferase
MTDNAENKITVDGVGYNVADLSDAAKQQIKNLKFVEAQLQQLNNEWAVADTARMGYSRALAQEAAKKD